MSPKDSPPPESSPSNLTVEVSDTDWEYSEVLNGIDEVISFVDKEIAFWDDLESIPGNIRMIPQHFRIIKGKLPKVKKQIQQSTNPEEVERIWRDLSSQIKTITTSDQNRRKRARVLFSKTPVAHYVKSYIQKDSSQASHAYDFLTDDNTRLPQNMTTPQLSGYIEAYLFKRTMKGNCVGALESVEGSLSTLHNDMQRAFEEIKQTVEAIHEDHIDWTEDRRREYETYVTDKESTLSNMENLYHEKLRLEAPVTEWNERSKLLRKSGRLWVAAIAATCCAIGLGLALLLYDLPDAFTNDIFSGDPSAIKGFLITIAIVTFAAYLVKIFSRFATSAFHLQRDAEERAKLTYVYLGMSKEGTLTKEDSQFFLESIFSRSDTGLLKHDSGPEMPLSAILRNIKT